LGPGDARPNDGQPFVRDLGAGVSCSVPLIVGADAGGTLPRVRAVPAANRKSIGFIPSGNDRNTRLADIALAWNVFQHFYPYFDVVRVDWAAALVIALQRAARDADEAAFRDTLRALVADLHDGHGMVVLGSRRPTHQLPLAWDWLDNELRITAIAPPAAGKVTVGDVVRAVDGRPASEVLAAAEQLQGAATPARRRFTALRELASGREGETVLLEVVAASGTSREVRLERSVAMRAVTLEKRPAPVSDLEPGTLYLDLTRISDAEMEAAIPRLRAAKKAVLDVRGYPRPTTAFLGFFSDHPLTGGSSCVPLVKIPDRIGMTFECMQPEVQPRTPRIRTPLAFLTDARAISYAETLLATVQNTRIGPIVGNATGGTNGNVHAFSLPGGYQVKWTAMRVTKADGSPLHGVGVLPTERVEPTLPAVLQGRDEVLERALELLGSRQR
jgi:hypothetical protein